MNVYVLTISHRHGVNVTVHKTAEGARAKLLEYVREEWAGEMEGEVIPTDSDEAIDAYFDNGHEEYDCTESTLQA